MLIRANAIFTSHNVRSLEDLSLLDCPMRFLSNATHLVDEVDNSERLFIHVDSTTGMYAPMEWGGDDNVTRLPPESLNGVWIVSRRSGTTLLFTVLDGVLYNSNVLKPDVMKALSQLAPRVGDRFQDDWSRAVNIWTIYLILVHRDILPKIETDPDIMLRIMQMEMLL